jgi:hypothetical protein
MKKALLLGFALLFISSAVFAQPPVGYFGLFTDDAAGGWCGSPAPTWPPSLTFYGVAVPGVTGLKCVEFRLIYDSTNASLGTATYNPGVAVNTGTFDNGIAICFEFCQTAMVWVFSMPLFSSPNPNVVEIGESLDTSPPVYQFANCEPGHPKEPFIKWSNLYVNYGGAEQDPCPPLGNESASWGAIKNLMNQ